MSVYARDWSCPGASEGPHACIHYFVGFELVEHGTDRVVGRVPLERSLQDGGEAIERERVDRLVRDWNAGGSLRIAVQAYLDHQLAKHPALGYADGIVPQADRSRAGREAALRAECGL